MPIFVSNKTQKLRKTINQGNLGRINQVLIKGSINKFYKVSTLDLTELDLYYPGQFILYFEGFIVKYRNTDQLLGNFPSLQEMKYRKYFLKLSSTGQKNTQYRETGKIQNPPILVL